MDKRSSTFRQLPDIFISYSRKDSAQTVQLAERLRADGMTVWIDQEGIEAATSWTKEIVQAIRDSKAVAVMLSKSALASHNVAKELSIASETRKPIIPIEIERIDLSDEFMYALAGLQRVKLDNYDAIVRAIKKLQESSPATPDNAAQETDKFQTKSPAKIIAINSDKSSPLDKRKTIMVLPFEDLSSEADNGWFADGLTEELIDALVRIKSIRTIDRRTSMDYKNFRGKTAELADELGVRYFVEGGVRRSGSQVKITARIYDSENGEYISSISHKGGMDDIFSIQEEVAHRTLGALQLKLTPADKQQLAARETSNTEAFELYLESRGHYSQQSQAEISIAIEMLDNALKLDPDFGAARILRAFYVLDFYRFYDKDPRHLTNVEHALKDAIARNEKNVEAHRVLGYCYTLQGRHEEAETETRRAIELDPDDGNSFFALGNVLWAQGMPREAAEAYEVSAKLNPFGIRLFLNLCLMYRETGNITGQRDAAERAIPQFERWLRLHPDDFYQRVTLCTMLLYADRTDEADTIAAELRMTEKTHGKGLYNLACYYLDREDAPLALECLNNAVEAGFNDTPLIRSWNKIADFDTNDKFRELLARVEKSLE